MTDAAAITKERVQRFLADLFGEVHIDRDGDFNFRHGSTHVYIRVHEMGKDATAVRVWSFTNRKVPDSNELFRYLAATNGMLVFGALSAKAVEDGVSVVLSHSLLGEYLDPAELAAAVAAVAQLADDFDDEIKSRFGGERYYED